MSQVFKNMDDLHRLLLKDMGVQPSYRIKKKPETLHEPTSPYDMGDIIVLEWNVIKTEHYQFCGTIVQTKDNKKYKLRNPALNYCLAEELGTERRIRLNCGYDDFVKAYEQARRTRSI